jgi:pimeloyl-ACP methyl ester carboxylesterase
VTELAPLDSAVLPAGVRSRFVGGVNGLRMHVLEAGFQTPGRPCVLLLHGFPESAWSWRRLLGPLAGAGYHVVAPDQRGYGRTTGWSGDYDDDLGEFRPLNVVIDMLALLARLGHETVAAVVGHDFGSPVAAWSALIRPDVFRSVLLMSAPFAGAPALPSESGHRGGNRSSPAEDLDVALARLDRPRKHYQSYLCTREANADMSDCAQGVHAFLRAYFHHKSADWPKDRPFHLTGWTAEELAKMPTYYVMDLDQDMPATVAREMPTDAEIAACGWLPDSDLRVYSDEYARTGFQGGLNWYRAWRDATYTAELQVFSGRTIDVPSMFLAGASDWGVYQAPGAFERMQHDSCTQLVGCHLVEGAGHWVQQEQPEQVLELLLGFLRAQR